ncbi:2-oxoacid:acceptor oxidoreductase family protein [Clostridium formicaceticum]|uniref:2-oxoacid:ferredoxin oxidoreductase subunit gamma n=1 Tax=Clostridium formicaceticum TaxID=1497 RepID=A0AAC9WKG5_9CLOT|nr:2-oxoacid:acceptor oxidoreductase family protein [Clostridium formicaceticum]AOY75264.1 2-oxoacid:ferredoxin oxidoreductase subunit gamma [Clostridium formicaceticum]ARE89700.1 Pyruvate synthase subunit PorC [Clostridium formicaceticum]
MMDKIILAGFGGQGVMFLGKVLAYAGMGANLEICWIPSYGPEMRGGTANCSVILSDEEINSPVIDEADAAIVLSKPAYDKFAPRIKLGGVLVVNTSLVKLDHMRKDIKIIQIPATDIANQLGYANIANMVCLGALLPNLKLIDLEKIENSMKQVTKKKPELLKSNLRAINKGIDYIRDKKIEVYTLKKDEFVCWS